MSTPHSPMDTNPSPTGIIAWFAYNPVAANLLMALIIAMGLYSVFVKLNRTIMPEMDMRIITVEMSYPGASPAEVEEGLILRIEEALADIEAIKRIDATAVESHASLRLELYEGFDVVEALNDTKNAIDAITSFPQDAEKPIVNRMQLRNHSINVQVHGDLNEAAMKALMEEVKEEMLRDPNIASIEIYGDRDYEITIEVSELTLQKYGLTLAAIAEKIRQTSIDLPGGSIKTGSGDIRLRVKGQAYRQGDFEQLVLLTYSDGTRLTLGDIAVVNDGFVDEEGFAYFDQGASMGASIYAVGEQDLIDVADAVKHYVANKKLELPPNVDIDYWLDATHYLEGRLNMMIKNLVLGALLVFIVLSLMLDIKLAFWVMVGLPLSFFGALAVLPWVGININMISLFGFILVLGIVVDDAIIIGESANHICQKKGHSVQHVVHGALSVATPATFGVLTTIVAFLPTLFTEGAFSVFPEAFGWVVILCLTFSLVESKWILPAHLAESSPAKRGVLAKINRVQRYVNMQLGLFIDQHYTPFVERCIRHRYITLTTFIALLIITMGLVVGGLIRYVLFPVIPAEFLQAEVEMVEGSADWQTKQAHDIIADALYAVDQKYRDVNGQDQGFIRHAASWRQSDRKAKFIVELSKVEDRAINANDIVQAWRAEVGEILGAKVVSITDADDFMGGAAISFTLFGKDGQQLSQAAQALFEKLYQYEGTYDRRSSASVVQDEMHLNIKPSAEALGLSLADLAAQVRHAFYGAEAQRIQRGDHEVKVMVRYPPQDRVTVANLENMMIRTHDGVEVPFSVVATVSVEPGYDEITRVNGQQAITVSAQADKEWVEPTRIVSDITENFMPELKMRYPTIDYQLDGESEETVKLFSSLFAGFGLALLGVYALLAIPLKSYTQPLMIMAVIPFGIVGAMFGHMVVGIAFSMMSFFGVIALSGVVVNDSLIMVDFVNRAKAKGELPLAAVIQAGRRRFRAILLTSLTTFFGLLPMLLESSLQAQVIVPMAVSLAFGILFATVITLLLVPCLYVVLEDCKRLFG